MVHGASLQLIKLGLYDDPGFLGWAAMSVLFFGSPARRDDEASFTLLGGTPRWGLEKMCNHGRSVIIQMVPVKTSTFFNEYLYLSTLISSRQRNLGC